MPDSKRRSFYCFHDLEHELWTVRAQVNFCDRFVGVESKTRFLAVDVLSMILEPLDWFRSLHDVSPTAALLSSWAEQSRVGIHPNDPKAALIRNWLDIPEELHSIEICHSANYIVFLAWWVAATQMTSVRAAWTADAKFVALVVEGTGEFGKVRHIEMGDGRDFWVLDVKPGTTFLPPEALAAVLLMIQLAAQKDGSTLIVHKLDERQVEFRLNIRRAEAGSVLPSWFAESDGVREQVTDHILRLVALSIQEVCQQLKHTLSVKELPRLELLLAEGEVNEDLNPCIRILHKAVGKLDDILQALDSWQRDHKAE